MTRRLRGHAAAVPDEVAESISEARHAAEEAARRLSSLTARAVLHHRMPERDAAALAGVSRGSLRKWLTNEPYQARLT